MPICLACNEDKQNDCFSPDAKRKTGHHPYCKPCKSLKMRAKRHVRKDHRELVLSRTEKKCPRCKEVKPLDSYHRDSGNLDGLNNYCKLCISITKKRNIKHKVSQSDIKLNLMQLIGGKCCHCGLEPSTEWPTNCFDFHHVDRSQKSFPLGRRMYSLSESDIKLTREEVLKCILLCANCHRRIHSISAVHPR